MGTMSKNNFSLSYLNDLLIQINALLLQFESLNEAVENVRVYKINQMRLKLVWSLNGKKKWEKV